MDVLPLSISLFGIFMLLLLLNVPISVALGISGVFTIILAQVPFSMVPVILFSATSKFTMLAIPFFILAGLAMERAGITRRLIDFVNLLVGHIRGGLAMVAVISCCFFSAISGSGPATVAAIGLVIIPSMSRLGYDKNFSTALVAASGEIGIIIPPSIALVVYGVISETSIGELFIAGVVPGLIIGLSFCVVSYIISLKKGYGGSTKRGSLKEIGIAFLRSLWGLFAPVIILGGIYGGMFTPTEAAAVAAAYGIIVGMFIYKAIDFKSLMNLLIDAAVSSSIIMIIVMNASVFAWLLTTGRVAQSIFTTVTDFTINPIFILIMINILLLIAGCFMDAISAYYIFIPLFLPICKEVGIDPIHLGIIMTVNLAIGLITPPVGVDLYTACSISGITLKEISGAIWPFVLAAIIGLIIITYIPPISLLLPTILGMR